jgi:hypothetical protein
MPTPGIVLVCLAAALLYYGGKTAVVDIGKVFKKSAQTISHPIRHPVKDAKAVKHVIVQKPKDLK